jgi:amino acid adenylation domain-containing protein/non-ribosomal peptide synthase protein (TIGR01720 family)
MELKVKKSNVQTILELSMVQAGMLFHYLRDDKDNLYNVQVSFDCEGVIDAELLQEAFYIVQESNDVLRSVFSWEKVSKPLQVILKKYRTEFICTDLSDSGNKEMQQQIESILEAEWNTRFDLSGLPIRISLIRTSTESCCFSITHHHILYDGWSTGILLKELFYCYSCLRAGSTPALTPKRAYKDALRDLHSNGLSEPADRFWNEYLEGYQPLAFFREKRLPGRFERSFPGKVSFSFEGQELKGFATRLRVTAAAVLYAAYGLLLRKYQDLSDVVFGTAVSSRDATLAGGEYIMGNFINTIPLRVNQDGGMTLRELVVAVNKDLIRRSPFNSTSQYEVTRLLKSHGQLFDSVFVVENYPLDVAAINSQPELRLRLRDVRENTGIPLLVTVFFRERVEVEFSYRRTHISDEEVQNLAGYFRHCLSSLWTSEHKKVNETGLLAEEDVNRQFAAFQDPPKIFDRGRSVVNLIDGWGRSTPAATAVEHNALLWSYAEMQERTLRLASWLKASGVEKGSRVTVYMAGGCDLLTVMLAIFRLRAVYVPIDIDFPRQRVEEIVKDSESVLMLSGAGMRDATSALTMAIPGLQSFCIEEILEKTTEDYDGMPEDYDAQDIAYMIYTSGTTGRPKGVMIHHLGMLNHLYAKIEALNLNEQSVIAQTASPCFDISIWQFLAALLVGGKTYIIDKEVQLDPPRLLASLERGHVTVIETVPSLLAGFLEALPPGQDNSPQALQWMVPTGEVLEVDLVRRWYARFPNVRLLNAYGPTECSDDVTHHVAGDPAEDQVVIPVGRPVCNTRIYILDANNNVCPPGVRGNIYIAGLGVGKGYWKDEEKTKNAFVGNPFAKLPEEADYSRLYRSGDKGYYLKNGDIICIGRGDDQVKIRGNRIEPGEITVCLNAHPDIKESVVAVLGPADGKYLVAYYVAEAIIDASSLRSLLSSRLPEYMVPVFFVHLRSLPLTANGKLDRKALPVPEPGKGDGYIAPQTNEQRLLAEAWSAVLGVERVGVGDNFFSIGGDSIKSIQISSRMRSAGYGISVKDIFENQTIRQLALIMRKTAAVSDQSEVSGTGPLTPIQRWLFEGPVIDKHHYNQSVLLDFPDGLSIEQVHSLFKKLQDHHDALRMVFREEDGRMIQLNPGSEMKVYVEEWNLRKDPDPEASVAAAEGRIQAGIDLSNGPLMRLGLFHKKDGTRLLIVIHHLVVDGISWRILFEDIETLYGQLQKGEVFVLPPKSDAFLSWGSRLEAYAKSSAFRQHLLYWKEVAQQPQEKLLRDYVNGINKWSENRPVRFRLTRTETSQLLTEVPAVFGTRMNEILLAALAISIYRRYGLERIKVDLEGHGREELPTAHGDKREPQPDVSRTVGWFTSIFPVVLEGGGTDLRTIIRSLKENLRKVPNNGIDYLLAKYLLKEDDPAFRGKDAAAGISFNYLGQFDTDTRGRSFGIAGEEKRGDHAPNEGREFDWDLSGMVTDGQLEMTLWYSQQQYKAENVEGWMAEYESSLREVISYCCGYGGSVLSPSDLSWRGLTMAGLDNLQSRYDVEDIYPLSPMQEGMLFHSLLNPDSTEYYQQAACRLKGAVDAGRIEQTLQELVDRHPVLRTVFIREGYDRPLQLVLRRSKANFRYLDLREECLRSSVGEVLTRYKEQDKAQRYDFTSGNLLRVTLLRTSGDEYTLLWSHHHILMDGWCMTILLGEFRMLYSRYSASTIGALPPVRPYSIYISWLEDRNRALSEQYWKDYLSGYEGRTSLPRKTAALPNELHDRSWTSNQLRYMLDEQETKSLQEFCGLQGITAGNVLTTAWGILLSKYNYTRDVVFGSVVSGRPAEIPGVENMIGLFINAIPVRIQFREDQPLSVILREVQARSLESEPYSYHSLAAVQALAGTGRELVDHILVIENYPVAPDTRDQTDFAITGMEVSEQTNYDLALVIVPGERLLFRFDYNPQVYTEETIRDAWAWLSAILREIIEYPERTLAESVMQPKEGGLEWLQELDRTNTSYPGSMTVHELFRRQAVIHADKIALRFGEQSLTYRQLDEKSNSLARLLRAKGVDRETIVGLLADRGIETVLGMLAILKAGGAYLPIDTDYPPERINYLVHDSGIRILLYTGELSYAAPSSVVAIPIGGEGLFPEDGEVRISGEGEERIAGDGELENSNRPSDLCYVIYTSGTTGNPKGVMVEHRNVVRLFFNDDFQFDFGSGDVWTMFHSHCFDFSVWEMYGALLFGGTLVIIPKMIARDSKAYLETLCKEKVTVLNQTPSSFYSLAQEELIRPEADLALKYVIFGGEALSPGKLKAWWSRYPGVQLINMFGITETTVHVTYKQIGQFEIDNNVSNIGKPIPTLSLHLADTFGLPAPKGAIGEMYVGGEGVARGYLGRETLTAQKFIRSRLHPDAVVYRSGDLARVLASGEIEYLGRMDQQVKIRGFRIELGEIEAVLNEHGSIGESAVIDKEGPTGKYLAAYYTSEEEPGAAELRNFLSARLPDYMIPAFFVQVAAIPLTANFKLDRKRLPDPVVKAGEDYATPESPEEQLLAGIWENVLGAERIGVTDNFFTAGGDSIKSIQISSGLRSEGYELTVKDIFQYPTIRELAGRLKKITAIADQSAITGEAGLTPIQKWFFEGPVNAKNHYNQAVFLRFRGRVSEDAVRWIFDRIQAHHDALRMVFRKSEKGWRQENKRTEMLLAIEVYDLSKSEEPNHEMHKAARKLQSGIVLETGPLMKLGLFQRKEESCLFIVIHHLVVDGVSWRVLFEDIETLYQQWKQGLPGSLPLKTGAFLSWAGQLDAYRGSSGFFKAARYWAAMEAGNVACSIRRDYPDGPDLGYYSRRMSYTLPEGKTSALLTAVHKAYRTKINDILLAAFFLAVRDQFGMEKMLIDLEGHGREDIGQDTRFDRTVGWFTSLYPVLLQAPGQDLPGTIKSIKECLRQPPNNGIDYLVYKYQGEGNQDEDRQGWDRCPPTAVRSSVLFNYMGGFDADMAGKSFSVLAAPAKDVVSSGETRDYDWDLSGIVTEGRFQMALTFSERQYSANTVRAFMDKYYDNLMAVIDHCCLQATAVLTPSDLTYKGLTISQLDHLQEQGAIEDIYPLTAMQNGMLYHTLLSPEDGHYFEQMVARVEGSHDMRAIEQSLNILSDRHAMLRTRFLTEGYGLPLQVVMKVGKVDFLYKDIRKEAEAGILQEVVERYRKEDRSRGFDLHSGRLMRLVVLQTGSRDYVFIWGHHHILMDGWCMGILLRDFRRIYSDVAGGEKPHLPEVRPYSQYIRWLDGLDKAAAARYWREYLAGYERLAGLPQKEGYIPGAQPYQMLTEHLIIPRGRLEQIQVVARRYGATLNTFIQAAWGILLAKYNNVNDVVFGAVVSGRPPEMAGVREMVGLFINTIPVRVRYNGDENFGDLVQQMQAQALNGNSHHYSSLPEVQTSSGLGNGLLNHILIHENFPIEDMLAEDQDGHERIGDTPDLILKEVRLFEMTSYDLNIMIYAGEDLMIRFDYNARAYEEGVIHDAIGRLERLLGRLMADEETPLTAVGIVDEGEQSMLLNDFNATAANYPAEDTLTSCFERQVGATPDKIAISYEGSTLTYRQLNEASNRVAHYLRRHYFVRADDCIAIMMDRSEKLIIGLLGILKAGAAYIPIDPAYPRDRVAAILGDSGVKILLTDQDMEDGMAFNGIILDPDEAEDHGAGMESGETENPPCIHTPANLCYLIYTPGPAGKPKGVMVSHHNVVNFLAAMNQRLPVNDYDRMLAVTGISFDISVLEIFWTLCRGVEVVIHPADVSPGNLDRYMEQINPDMDLRPVTLMQSTPSFIKLAMEGGGSDAFLSSLRLLLLGGEALPATLIRRLGAVTTAEIYHMYGPTETTIWSCMNKIEGDPEKISIGKPILNTQLYILSRELQVMPAGLAGDLYIGGEGLSRGYWGNPALTAERFIDHPFQEGKRIYKTGDIARWQADGTLELIRRDDDQVKIRGYRIELGEVESALPEEEMLAEDAYIAPSGPLEEKLVEIWSEVLGVDASVIGVDAEFFRLGGHSLNAVIAINRIGEEFKINLPWKLFLRISTVKEIATYIQAVAVKTAESREQAAESREQAGESREQAGEELREQLVF